MKKKTSLIILFFSLVLFLAWCSKTWIFNISFDWFHINYWTDQSFETNKDELNWLGYQLINNNILQIYSEKNYSWDFKESIIIAKKSTDKTLSGFTVENIENTNIKWFKSWRWKTFVVKCHEEELPAIYYNSRYNTNQYNVYLSQWFIKSWNKIYTISYATLDETKRNQFSSDLKKTYCK